MYHPEWQFTPASVLLREIRESRANVVYLNKHTRLNLWNLSMLYEVTSMVPCWLGRCCLIFLNVFISWRTAMLAGPAGVSRWAGVLKPPSSWGLGFDTPLTLVQCVCLWLLIPHNVCARMHPHRGAPKGRDLSEFHLLMLWGEWNVYTVQQRVCLFKFKQKIKAELKPIQTGNINSFSD